MLGYRVGGYWSFRDMAQAKNLTMDQIIARAHSLIEQQDAFKDTPWPILYKELDQAYPGSKFIHVVRDSQKWIASASRDFGTHPNSIHQLIYGCPCPVGNEKIWGDRYEKHNREVVEYFKDRPDDFLSLHMDRGELNFEPICQFLGKPIPSEPWPHVNQIADKKRRMFASRVMRKLGLNK